MSYDVLRVFPAFAFHKKKAFDITTLTPRLYGIMFAIIFNL